MTRHTPLRSALAAVLAGLLTAVAALAAGRGATGTAASPHVKLRSIDLDAARWTDGFWAQRFDLCRRVTIPTMLEVMNRPDNSANFQNLRIAAGLAQGKFFGNNWSDGDCYKWIEAAASLFAVTRDPEMDRQMDELIAVIAKAQTPDGYISTQIQLTDKGRWTDLKHHELYNMGHLLTAACVHHRATGKENFLAVARKLGDYLCTVFLPRPKELAHFGFNPSNVMGAAELYRTTGDEKYLRLAQTFVDMRGSQPGGSDQNQSKVPLRKEQEAVGHAVTAAYLWCGAADVYAETGEGALFDALQRLWVDVTTRKMYITGGLGALHHGESQRVLLKRWPRDSVHEAFGAPYQLPNRTAYNETCANIAGAMWAWRMLALTGEAQYAEVMERVLYNSMLSGIGVEGKDYFYTNPLRRCGPDVPLSSNDSAQRWPDTTPPSPVHCFCCPPNVARTIAQLHAWAYGVSEDGVWVHRFGGGRLETRLPGGRTVRLTQTTDYPWDGRVTICIERAPSSPMTLRLRVPAWAASAAAKINGRDVKPGPQAGSYFEIRRQWSPQDTVQLDLPLEVRAVEAHPLVEEARGHVAVMRGPIVYCLESVDLPEGVALDDIRLPRQARWTVRREPGLLGGVSVLETEAQAVVAGAAPAALYRPLADKPPRPVKLRLIPYYAWANRGRTEMTVWLPAL